MELYVLRHAIAATQSEGQTDADRALTAEGIERLRKVTRAFEAMGVRAEVIVTSPYVRARATAELVAGAVGGTVTVAPALAAGATPEEIVQAIAVHAAQADRVMIVGHEPDLGRLVSRLISGVDVSAVRFKKAGLAKLTMDALGAGRCARLEWLATPKHMLAIA